MPATSVDLSQIKTDSLASASAFRALIGLGTLATQSATITDYLTIASAASTYQPLDSDLTSIAALTTTAFGRSLLTEASATTARSTLGLGTLATQSPTGTPSASTFLRGDFSWQTIDLSGYLPLAGGTMTGQLTITQGTANTSVLASTGYSLTGSNAQSLIDVAGTWNTTGTPTLIKANVTDTASNGASDLLNLQVNATVRAKIAKSGDIYARGYFQANGTTTGIFPQTNTLFFYANGGVFAQGNIAGNFSIGTAGVQATLASDLTDVLAQRNGTNAQTYRIYNTFTDASNYERAKIAWESNVLRIGTEKAGTGSARALELQTDGVTRLTIGATGSSTFANRVMIDNAPSGGALGSPLLLVGGPAYTTTNQFYTIGFGFTNSFSNRPPIEIGFDETSSSANTLGDFIVATRNVTTNTAATVRVRIKADGTFGIEDGNNIEVGTTTGTKIGTATTQKLGFYNATPVVQPTAVADATDAASVITQLNALLSRMRDLGLIAT